MTSNIDDGIILAARLFLAALFLIFGWRKIADFPGTVRQMASDGVISPVLVAVGSIIMELPVAFLVAVGAFARPAAALMALYSLGTSLIEHRYWSASQVEKLAKMEAFYKNLCIIGGFLLLGVVGPGRYSIDAILGFAAL